jgi:uncharacterized membrane protein YhaH (DUF805 family)
MPFLLAFRGRIARLPYLLWSLGIFLSQHLFIWLVFAANGRSIPWGWEFVLVPLRLVATSLLLVKSWPSPELIPLVAVLLQLLITWMLAALAFQRASDAGLGGWIAGFALVPIVQIGVMLGLSLAPAHDAATPPRAPADPNARNWPAAARAALGGMAVTVPAVALGTLAFGSYGYGVFVVSPFIIGLVTGVMANRKVDMGSRHTSRLVTSALALGGGALMLVAIEGFICILMAAPLALGMGWLGGHVGRAIAIQSYHPAQNTLASFAVLPLVLLGETLLAPSASFQSENAIAIAAPPAAVWESLVDMGEISGPLPLPFRLGLAHPLRGRVIGEGVGAVRLGVFSTGTALECITEWEPGRKLAFSVLRDVPAMRELSPYEHVHAPHLIGYFFTADTRFELLPAENGGTTLVLRSTHTLRLEPVLYWLPLARMVVDQNNTRVLAHIKRRAESVHGAAEQQAPDDADDDGLVGNAPCREGPGRTAEVARVKSP